MAPGAGDEIDVLLEVASEIDACQHPELPACPAYEMCVAVVSSYPPDDPDVGKTLVALLSTDAAPIRYAAAKLLAMTCWYRDEVLLDRLLTRLAFERDPIVAERLAMELVESAVDLYDDDSRRRLMVQALTETTVDAVYRMLGPSGPGFPEDAQILRELATQGRVARRRRDALELLEALTGPDPQLCTTASERVLAAMEGDANDGERLLLGRAIDARAPSCAPVYARLLERGRELVEIDQLHPEVYALLIALNVWMDGRYRVELERVSKLALRSFRYPELRDRAAAQLERWRLADDG